jgi:hypothetical protein
MRPTRALQSSSGGIAVYRDDQGIGQGSSALQVTHVAHVKQIEDAIGEGQLLTPLATRCP